MIMEDSKSVAHNKSSELTGVRSSGSRRQVDNRDAADHIRAPAQLQVMHGMDLLLDT